MVKDWTENDRTKQKPKTNKQSNKQKQGLENYMEKYVLKKMLCGSKLLHTLSEINRHF